MERHLAMNDDDAPVGVAIWAMPAAMLYAFLADALFAPWYPLYRFIRRRIICRRAAKAYP
jgi:hypothetical protein